MNLSNILISKRLFHKNYYSALGLPTTSTLSEIKAAYYKLSKIYHPDLNKNEEASKNFKEINEAYEILSNVKLKKLYDKGLLSNINVEDTPQDKFHKSRNTKHRPPINGNRPIYDFDAWTRHHYSYTFNLKQNQNIFRNLNKNSHKNKITDNHFFILTTLLTICLPFLMLQFCSTSSDEIVKKN